MPAAPLVTTLFSNLIGFGALLPFLVASLPQVAYSPRLASWLLLFVTAVVMHGIVTLIWNSQLQKVGAAKAAMFSNLEPFIAMLFGFFLLAKPITAVQLFGAVLIIAGVTLTTTSKEPRDQHELSSFPTGQIVGVYFIQKQSELWLRFTAAMIILDGNVPSRLFA